jgi:hypothetical protein
VTNNYKGLAAGCGRTGTATVIFTATDACGKQSSCTRTLTITDTTAPIISCTTNAVFECDGAGNTAQINTWLASVTASDTCSGTATVTNNYKGLAAGCGRTGTATVTFTATDACGKQSSCTRTLTVSDSRPPSITCPPATNVCGFASIPAPDTTKVSASDTCSTPTKTFVRDTYVTNSGVITVTRTYKATDACSNSASCTQTITVNPIPPCTLAAPNPPPVADVSGYTLSGPAGNFLYGWSITATTGPNWQITSATNIQTISYAAGSSGTATFQLVVIDKATGCRNTCTVTVGIGSGGATPGFWGNKNGLALLTAADFTALNNECLRNGSGGNQDFTGSLSNQKSAFDTWLANRNAVNMAYQFSAHLAAFTLNVRHLFICPGAAISLPGCGGSVNATNLITLCNNALCADGATLSGDTNRPSQECLKNALANANGSTTTTAKTCP